MRIKCDSCPMASGCERIDKDYTCDELIRVYRASILRARRAVNKHKVLFEDLYIINAGWGMDDKLNIKLGRGLNEHFVKMEAREAVLKYGAWIVEGYRNNDIILYKGD